MTHDLLTHPDGKCRCLWPGTDPIYVAYHDMEWGVPEYDDLALFEKLILDGFPGGAVVDYDSTQARQFSHCLQEFDPEKIAKFDARKIEQLMKNEGIVRNRAKIEGAVKSVRAWLEIQQRYGFSNFLWNIAGGPQQNKPRTRADVPPETEVSRKMSTALRNAGFAFCGPTIVYAFMEAVGMVNDHIVGCYRLKECAALGESHLGGVARHVRQDN